jgi:hypothetical protein
MSGYEFRTPEIEKKVRRQLAAEKRAEEPKCWNCKKRKQHLQPFAPFCSDKCEYEYHKVGF